MSKKSDSWLTFVHLVANIEAELGKVLQDRYGLGLSDYRALNILSRAPDTELRMQDLALHLRLNQSSVSRMVERLEKGGLTVRDLCPDDKRGVYTVLTEQGNVQLKKAQVDYEAALTALLEKYGCENLMSLNFAATE